MSMIAQRASLVFALLPTVIAAAPARAEPPAPAAGAPEIDPGSVVFYPDEGRLELRGARLAGLRVRWQPGAGGEATCVDPRPAPAPAAGPAHKDESCVLALARDLPTDVTLSWAPP